MPSYLKDYSIKKRLTTIIISQAVIFIILFCADPVHIGLVTVKIALGEALPGESPLQHAHFLRGRSPVLPQELRIHPCDNTRILRSLHASFDFHAGNASFVKRLQAVCQTVVLKR